MSVTACAAVMAAVTAFRGVTFVDKPIVLTPADSGKTFVGEPGAVISGGVKLGPWTEGADGVWSSPAPRESDGRVMFFDQLWIGGRRAPNACLPDSGWLPVASGTQTRETDGTWTDVVGFSNSVADVLASVPVAERAYVQAGAVTMWSYARRTLVGYDVATHSARMTGGDEWKPWKRWGRDVSLVRFQNVRGAFDAPGEWFLDVAAGRVLYLPRPGERPSDLVAIAPRYGLSRLVEFRGDPDHGAFVTNVTFRNITFAHTAFTGATPARGPVAIEQWQAAFCSDGAITARGAHGCRFENCRVAHTGNHGMRFDSGCVSNVIVGCTFEDLGAGGIWMGEELTTKKNLAGCTRAGAKVPRLVVRPDVPTATAFNLVSNCTIRAAGRYNPEGGGVVLAHCSDSKVVHCDIHDIAYTGVTVGWSWGFAGSVAQRNEIAFNRIWDLGKGVMSDLGGVYTLGTSFGTTVHDNVIHDVRSYSYGGWGLYLDEGSEGIVLERNLVWNTTDGGIHQHYGTGCIVRNNIFAWNRELGAVRIDHVEENGVPCWLDIVNNIFIGREGPLVGAGVRPTGGVWANNLWYDARGAEEVLFDGLDWKDWKAIGKETLGRFADPKFVDAERFDFALRPDSPAFELGFRAWDHSKAGRK